MDRRQYLALSGAALSSIAAGCSYLGDGGGDGTPTESGSVSGPRPEEVRSALESEGFEMGAASLDDGILSIEYASEGQTEAEVAAEAEPVVRAFLDALEAGMDAEWLEAWLVDGEDGTRAVYTVHESRVRAWGDGEESDEEFFGHIESEVSWQ